MARPVPPIAHCRDCGGAFRTWRRDPLCGDCIEALVTAPPRESLRAFRARLAPLPRISRGQREADR